MRPLVVVFHSELLDQHRSGKGADRRDLPTHHGRIPLQRYNGYS
jgi:hypothetical protein